jgi:maltose O-acetyltransferase
MKFKEKIKALLKKNKFFRAIAWILAESRMYRLRQISNSKCREIGKGAYIDENVKINRPDRVIIKNNACIHSGSVINSKGGLIIGKNVIISYNCTIFTSNHRYRGAKSIPFDNVSILQPVVIEDYVWIGMNVSIYPGIEIGEGAIVSMGSVVTKNIPPLAIVRGNPAEVVRYRDEENYYNLKENGKIQEGRVKKYDEVLLPDIIEKKEKILQQLGMI